jgi:glyoxylase-like metal-dependent hydrolase (beta-lactamase superfamily II)
MRDLFFLTSGQFRAPALVVAAPGGRASLAPVVLSNTVAVCVHDDGTLTLIDCGWSEEVCADAPRVLGAVAARLATIDARRGESAVAQLRALGFPPSAVRTIVATHLHWDHIGGACDFPDAEVLTSEQELADHHRLSGPVGYRAADLARAGRVTPVRLDGPPMFGFPRSHALSSDVVMLDARGHTGGSIAVVLRGPAGAFVHVGDAVYQTWELHEGAKPSLLGRMLARDRKALAETRACIRQCARELPGARIVPSHDASVFAELPRAPRAQEAGMSARARETPRTSA